MKLDISDCPDPRINQAGFDTWLKREKQKYPAPDSKTDWEAFEKWVIEFSDQIPYRLAPKPFEEIIWGTDNHD